MSRNFDGARVLDEPKAPSAVQTGGRGTDIATVIATTMRQMGVLGIPRNYELYYEAYAGSIPDLGAELNALGAKPTQEDLDRIGQKYLPTHHGHTIIESAQAQITRDVQDLVTLLGREQSSLEKYGEILSRTSDGLSNMQLMTKDILQRIVSVMSVATDSTIDRSRQMLTTMADKSVELEKVKSSLEEYKKLAETDPLTQLANRRAFDRFLSKIYDSERGIIFSALVVADIDRFKHVNDTFGHPVGDRIIQVVAGILKSKVRDDMFVARTGGEEFALIIEGASADATMQIAERIRAAIEATPFINKKTSVNYGPITVSMGVCMASDADGPDDLYDKADRAMYAAKMAGRNSIKQFSVVQDQRSGKNWMLYSKE